MLSAFGTDARACRHTTVASRRWWLVRASVRAPPAPARAQSAHASVLWSPPMLQLLLPAATPPQSTSTWLPLTSLLLITHPGCRPCCVRPRAQPRLPLPLLPLSPPHPVPLLHPLPPPCLLPLLHPPPLLPPSPARRGLPVHPPDRCRCVGPTPRRLPPLPPSVALLPLPPALSGVGPAATAAAPPPPMSTPHSATAATPSSPAAGHLCCASPRLHAVSCTRLMMSVWPAMYLP